MTRRRWVYFGEEAVEVSDDYVPESRNHDGVLWNDRLYQDDRDPRYASRAQHREYMRRNGLTTADDFTETWKRAAAEREKIQKGIDSTRKTDVNEALERVRSGYKPRRIPSE